ncbi:GNAT family N-acetyltransferase [Microbacterium sp. M28]|uniref:GNAT family N-acetyltransferase n=1 Tax=Microbacterium sp. M28 TaxID=2962064 RepID=UPI0021F4ABF2|nr:GNAT family N-acetyltransferase [Microbacterium sp. M28]UYO98495.1 GNAT family N-acetyltransferase [Microbacterium sp. M28]
MVKVRWARTEDAADVAEVHVDAWRSAYARLIDQAVLDGLDVDRRATMWASFIARSLQGLPPEGYDEPAHRLLVAEDDDRILGWAAFGPGRDDGQSHRGELAGLYAHPSVWSRGVGHALIACVDEELRAQGFADAYLWVLAGNERAIGFYERHGWIADGGEKFGDAGGATGLHELRHVRALT